MWSLAMHKREPPMKRAIGNYAGGSVCTYTRNHMYEYVLNYNKHDNWPPNGPLCLHSAW